MSLWLCPGASETRLITECIHSLMHSTDVSEHLLCARQGARRADARMKGHVLLRQETHEQVNGTEFRATIRGDATGR